MSPPRGDHAEEFVGLRFDPAPGSVETSSRQARAAQAAAEELDQARGALRPDRSGGGQGWQGSAAGAFAAATARLAEALREGHDTLTGAGSVLSGWSEELAALRSAARHREHTAREARARFEAAATSPDLLLVDDIPAASASDPAAGAALRGKVDAAVAELTAAHASLTAAVDEGHRVAEQHTAAGHAAARRLAAEAVEPAPMAWAATRRTLEDRQQALGRGVGAATRWAVRHGRVAASASAELRAAGTDLVAHGRAALVPAPSGPAAPAATTAALPPLPSGGLALRMAVALDRCAPSGPPSTI